MAGGDTRLVLETAASTAQCFLIFQLSTPSLHILETFKIVATRRGFYVYLYYSFIAGLLGTEHQWVGIPSNFSSTRV